MSIPVALPNRGVLDSGASGVVCAARGTWKPFPQVRIVPSPRLRCCPRQRIAGRGVRITACAAPPCQSTELVSATVIERLGLRGVEFESSSLQVVKEGLVFQQARSSELIRAAAYLRAVSFYTIPEGRSEEAVQVT